jgi:hypothetical protein
LQGRLGEGGFWGEFSRRKINPLEAHEFPKRIVRPLKRASNLDWRRNSHSQPELRFIMRDFRAVYRGYAIYLSDAGSWSVTAMPLKPELPILARAKWEGHPSQRIALETAKHEIDELLDRI